MKILLGVTGSTGVKLVPKLIKKLESDGHAVQTIVTPAAKKLMKILAPSFIEKSETRFVLYDEEGELFEYEQSGYIAHIDLARWADIFAVVPCTSNTLNKISIGLCDNLLLSTLKAFESSKRVLLAPAMNTVMLEKDIGLLDSSPFEIAFPTVKKLSCGDFGLGALADIDDIANLIGGHKWRMSDNVWHPGIYYERGTCNVHYLMAHPGRFGASRKHDVHTGVDLYSCQTDLSVGAFEEGTVVSIGPFTGPDANCEWWYNSKYVAVKGRSGIIVYGEIEPSQSIKIGESVTPGQLIGDIVQVLRHPPNRPVPGHSMYMLHVELLDSNSSEFTAEDWELGKERPRHLKDPTVYLHRRHCRPGHCVL